MAFTRILFATDVHGSDPVWHKFIRGGQHYKANAVVIGGDLTGKGVVPVTANKDGTYFADFQDQKHVLRDRDALAKFEEILRRNGTYMFVGTPGEMEELGNDKAKADRVFDDLILKRVEEWMEFAEAKATTPVYINAGNDDIKEIDEVVKKSSPVVLTEDLVIQIDAKHEMISGGFANITPWKCPRDLTEEAIAQKIEQKVSMLKDVRSSIFNLHCPPIDSGLDTCPKLDTSMDPPRPIVRGGGLLMYGAGSTSIRAAIEKHQPMLGLHGHIHESRNMTKIGRTVCINPGSEYAEGILRGALVNFDESGFKSYQFISG